MKQENLEGLNHHPSLCEYGTSRLRFRGPKYSLHDPFIAFLGGSETYASQVSSPFPALIQNALGQTCINFAQQQASADVFLNDSTILDACRSARLTIISVNGAANASNRFYSVHPRRNNRFVRPSEALCKLFPEVDYSQICFTDELIHQLRRVDRSRFNHVREELEAAWCARMRTLVDRIGPEVVLLWFAPFAPPESAIDDGEGPVFVSAGMLESLSPLVRATVIVSEAHCSSSEPVAHQKAAAALLGPIRHVLMEPRSQSGTHSKSAEPTLSGSTSRLAALGIDATRSHVSAVPLSHFEERLAPVDRYINLTGRSLSSVFLPQFDTQISVRPFTSLSAGDIDSAYESILRDEITASLVRSARCDTSSLDCVEGQQDETVVVPRMHEYLSRYTLSGSVYERGQLVRVVVKLSIADTEECLFAGHYEYPIAQRVTALEEIAKRVRNDLLGVLGTRMGSIARIA